MKAIARALRRWLKSLAASYERLVQDSEAIPATDRIRDVEARWTGPESRGARVGALRKRTGTARGTERRGGGG